LKLLEGNPSDIQSLYAYRNTEREGWIVQRFQQEWKDTDESHESREQLLRVTFATLTFNGLFDEPDVALRPNLTLDSNPRLEFWTKAQRDACSERNAWGQRTCVLDWFDPGGFSMAGPLTSVTLVDGRPSKVTEPTADFMSMLLLFWGWPPWGQ
jgi:hypothetical protein